MRDNGCGFDPRQSHGESHVGLKIMTERAERIGAKVSLNSLPGEGTTMQLALPAYPAVNGGATENLEGQFVALVY